MDVELMLPQSHPTAADLNEEYTHISLYSMCLELVLLQSGTPVVEKMNVKWV